MKTLFSLLPRALLEALATKHDEALTACMAVGGCPWTSADRSSTGARPMCENQVHDAVHLRGCVV